MAIQIPNPGTGNGATGDNEFILWSKVKDNFSDQTNAASRLVGAENGNVPTYSAANGLSGLGYGGQCARLPNATNLFSRTWVTGYYNGNNLVNTPLNSAGWFFIEAIAGTQANKVMLRLTFYTSGRTYLAIGDNGAEASWTAWEETPLAKDVASTLTGQAIDVTSVKAGAASYKRGWRKLTSVFGSGASTISIPHGVSNIVGVTVSAIVTGVSYYPNDARATHQFTVRAGGVNLIIEKSAGATALDGVPLTIYIDEEL